MGTRTVGLTALIRDLETLAERAEETFPKVVSKGALNIKTDWRAGWNAIKRYPTHIPHIVSGIGYDTDDSPPEWSASVGVDAANRQAFLAHILEYGTVHNAPYPAGQAALDAEEPLFVKAVGDAGVDLLEGR